MIDMDFEWAKERLDSDYEKSQLKERIVDPVVNKFNDTFDFTWESDTVWSAFTKIVKDKKDEYNKKPETNAGKAWQNFRKWLWTAASWIWEFIKDWVVFTADVWEEIWKWLIEWTAWLWLDILDALWDWLAYASDFTLNTKFSESEWFLDQADAAFDKFIKDSDIIKSDWWESDAWKIALWWVNLITQFAIPWVWILWGSSKWLKYLSKLLKNKQIQKELMNLDKLWQLNRTSFWKIIQKYWPGLTDDVVEQWLKFPQISASLNKSLSVLSPEKQNIFMEWLNVLRNWWPEAAALIKAHPWISWTIASVGWIYWLWTALEEDQTWTEWKNDPYFKIDETPAEEDIRKQKEEADKNEAWVTPEDNMIDTTDLGKEPESTIEWITDYAELVTSNPQLNVNTSLVDHLKALWLPSDGEFRIKLADALWIKCIKFLIVFLFIMN